ncbi:MAG: PH domain-containing protein [Methanobacteriaceae archaeon]
MVNWKIGESFNPAKQLKTLYYIYFLITIMFMPVIVLVISFFYILFLPEIKSTAEIFGLPVLEPLFITMLISLLIPIILLFILYWIPKFYSTIIYKLDDEGIECCRGVWFKHIDIVPYNRITEVHISQGPISRMLKIGSLKIRTASYIDYYGSRDIDERLADFLDVLGTLDVLETRLDIETPPETILEGMEEFEELKYIIMDLTKVKTCSSSNIRRTFSRSSSGFSKQDFG